MQSIHKKYRRQILFPFPDIKRVKEASFQVKSPWLQRQCKPAFIPAAQNLNPFNPFALYQIRRKK
jgi:hypothetical protein